MAQLERVRLAKECAGSKETPRKNETSNEQGERDGGGERTDGLVAICPPFTYPPQEYKSLNFRTLPVNPPRPLPWLPTLT